jgi:LysR family transcriptional regulator, nod-box dependent transcriptional activator
VRFKGLDLNLLGAFDALLETRSVSGASRQMNLSQPAVSAALMRLRTYFDDDLLVVQGRRMVPTAYAETLVPQVRDCLRAVEAMLETSSRFDPATSQRRFRLIASDYVMTAVMAPMLETLARQAPGIRIELTLPGEGGEADLREGRADIHVAPEQFLIAEHPHELLFEEDHVVVGARQAAAFAGAWDRDTFLGAGHIVVRIGGTRDFAFADRQLHRMGIERRIAIEAPSFDTVPWLLTGTDRLALMPRRLARRMADSFPLAWKPVPFTFPPMREMIQYRRHRTADEGLHWLIGLMRKTVQARA